MSYVPHPNGGSRLWTDRWPFDQDRKSYILTMSLKFERFELSRIPALHFSTSSPRFQSCGSRSAGASQDSTWPNIRHGSKKHFQVDCPFTANSSQGVSFDSAHVLKDPLSRILYPTSKMTLLTSIASREHQTADNVYAFSNRPKYPRLPATPNGRPSAVQETLTIQSRLRRQSHARQRFREDGNIL